jgi:hypothetical protein
MKQAEMAAQSSGRSGGESRVFDCPGAGVLQKMPMATSFTRRSPTMLLFLFYKTSSHETQICVIRHTRALSTPMALNISIAVQPVA